MKNQLHIDPSVFEAISSNRPVVALESTIISHGMPYPQNVETALNVEAKVREHGAIPATIAIINGVMKAGLTVDEIEIIGKQGQAVSKVSRRDMPMILTKKMNGATTVASTMIIAQLAGIHIFATGGIGGKIDDFTGDELKLFKRKVYLIIVSSLSFEECAHKLVKSNIPEHYEMELCRMILECCAQEKTYRRFYGLLAQRFCELKQVYRSYMMELFPEQVSVFFCVAELKKFFFARFFARFFVLRS